MTEIYLNVYEEIKAERERQDQQWGGADHDDLHQVTDWSSLVRHQMLRYDELAGRHMLDPTWTWQDRARELRKRMVKAAALAIACIEVIDRRLAGILPEHTGQPVQPNLCDDPDCPRCGIPKHE